MDYLITRSKVLMMWNVSETGRKFAGSNLLSPLCFRSIWSGRLPDRSGPASCRTGKCCNSKFSRIAISPYRRYIFESVFDLFVVVFCSKSLFLAVQDSSIGDLVTQSVSETHLISDYNDYKTRVTTETVFNDLVT